MVSRGFLPATFATFLSLLTPGAGHGYLRLGRPARHFFALGIAANVAWILLYGLVLPSYPVPLVVWTILAAGIVAGPAIALAAAISAWRAARRGAGEGESHRRSWAIGLAMLAAWAVVTGTLSEAGRSSLVQAFKIPSGAMIPTLLIGDHILVQKSAYRLHTPFVGSVVRETATPARGDIVVFEYPEDPNKDFIKRVAAVAGDVVEIRAKKLVVNGAQVDDPRVRFADGDAIAGQPQRDNFGPFTVPANAVFVLGDNRDRSYDSRFWGPVMLDKIKGKAFLIYWSWNASGSEVRWQRIGSRID